MVFISDNCIIVNLQSYHNYYFCFLGNQDNIDEYKKDYDFTDAPNEFTIGIHDPFTISDIRSEGIKVKTGYETNIVVTPRILHTTKSAEKMNYKDRSCLTRS